MKKTIFFYLILLTLGCKQKIDCNLNEDILKFNDSIIQKSKSEKWLSKFLSNTNDSELIQSEEKAYRFMILGAWGSISSYKITKNNNKISITKKNYWEYYDDRKIDSLGKEKKKELKIKDWIEVENYLANLNFWTSPVIKKNDYGVLDGTSYLIEGYSMTKNKCTNRNYHLTNRISPPKSDEYRLLFSKIEKLIKE